MHRKISYSEAYMKWHAITLLSFYGGIAVLPLQAQGYSQQLVSSFGIGILSTSPSLAWGGMNSYGIAQNSPLIVAPANPATSANVRYVLFDIATRQSQYFYRENLHRYYTYDLDIHNLTFSSPLIANRIGISAGVLPVSRIGYNIVDTLIDPLLGTVRQKYTGNGGFTKAFVNIGYKFTLDSIHALSVGLATDYLFGNIYKIESKEFLELTNAYNNRRIRSLSPHAVVFSYGFTYTFARKKYSYIVGATYTPTSRIKAHYDYFLYTYAGRENLEQIKDTITWLENNAYTTTLPQCFAIGLTLERNHVWQATVEYRNEQWSNTSLFGESYADMNRISAGAYWIPEGGSIKKWKTYKYSWGGSYTKGYAILNEKKLSSVSCIGGISIPVKYPKTYGGTIRSSINFNVEIGKRSTFESSSKLEEIFLHLYFGINIADRWFIKRKYN